MYSFSAPPPRVLADIPARTRAAIKTRFDGLLARIEPGNREELIYEQHKTTVTRRLNSAFSAHDVLPIGSSTRGSAIGRYSDLDLLLVLRAEEVRWGSGWKSSSAVLNGVRDQLRYRFQGTDIGRDGQAVVVEFADGQHPVDVVPGFFGGLAGKSPTYWIPDGVGGWMKTSPMAHNRYISAADVRSGGKLKNVAKLIKYWRVCRSPEMPLSSFHLELLLAQSTICDGIKTYGHCLYGAFKLLADRSCAALQDPMQIAGLVRAANTEAKRTSVLSAVQSARNHAASALMAEQKGLTNEALRQWDIVFNGCFPR